MPRQVQCPDDPSTILRQAMCLSALSKDLKGQLRLNASRPRACENPPCKTLKTIHALKLEARAHRPCDSSMGKAFDGIILVERLVTAFDQDGEHRGFHAGDFKWTGTGVRVVGRMSGVTNVGTHRRPAFKDCQSCDARGVMEGRLCGKVVVARDPALRDCQIMAAYRISFKPGAEGGNGPVVATLEGVIICPCRQ